MNKTITIYDKNQKANKWNIEYDNGETYTVTLQGYETLIYKNRVLEFEGNLSYDKDITLNNYNDKYYHGFDNISCYNCNEDISSRFKVVTNEDGNYICKKCIKDSKINY